MKTSLLLPVLGLVSCLGAGCAAPDVNEQAAEPREQAVYRTGSNLPVRVAKPKTKEERDRAAEEAEQARRDAEKILRPGS